MSTTNKYRLIILIVLLVVLGLLVYYWSGIPRNQSQQSICTSQGGTYNAADNTCTFQMATTTKSTASAAPTIRTVSTAPGVTTIVRSTSPKAPLRLTTGPIYTPVTPPPDLGTYPIHIVSGASSMYYVPNQTVSDLINMYSPTAGSMVTSPTFSISGTAAGSWFSSSGSFPIVLTDANGTILAEGMAKALGTTQTTGFVSYSASVTYPAQTYQSAGVLVLEEANSSGSASNNASVEIPITFQ